MEEVNYWEEPEWYQKRNAEIVKDKDNGMTNAQLVGKYGISQSRILAIVKRYKEDINFERE